MIRILKAQENLRILKIESATSADNQDNLTYFSQDFAYGAYSGQEPSAPILVIVRLFWKTYVGGNLF